MKCDRDDVPPILFDNHDDGFDNDLMQQYVEAVAEAGLKILRQNGRGDYLKPVPYEEIVKMLDHLDIAGALSHMAVHAVFETDAELKDNFKAAQAIYPFPICGQGLGKQIANFPENVYRSMRQFTVPVAIKEAACTFHKKPEEKYEVVIDNLRSLIGETAGIVDICSNLAQSIQVKLEFATLIDKGLADKLNGLKWVILAHLSASKRTVDPDRIRELLEDFKTPAGEFSAVFSVFLMDINRGDTPLSALDEVLKEINIFAYCGMTKGVYSEEENS